MTKTFFVVAFLGAATLASVLLVSETLRGKVSNRLHNAYIHIRYQPDTPEELGNGRPASEILLHDPMGLARDGEGNLYVSDRGLILNRAYRGQVVWKIDPGGIARIIAGNGRRGTPTTGVPATLSNLGSPEGIAVDGAGRVYIADHENNVVLRVESNGLLTRIAGTGEKGFGGDNGPANRAKLNRPYDVRLDQDGNLYVADQGNNRIRRISPEGYITTVAGTGDAGYSGDGGRATDARLQGPYNIVVDSAGRLLIADSENHVIRRVDNDGVITTVAGSGVRGYSGDEAAALEAKFDTPQSLAIDKDGILYVSDEDNHHIRAIDPASLIHNFAGSDGPGSSADDGTDREHLLLDDPENLLLLPDGSLLVTDAGHHRVIAITPDGLVRTIAGRAYPKLQVSVN